MAEEEEALNPKPLNPKPLSPKPLNPLTLNPLNPKPLSSYCQPYGLLFVAATFRSRLPLPSSEAEKTGIPTTYPQVFRV